MKDYSKIPSEEVLNITVQNLTERGFNPIVVDTKEQALEKIKELMPKGSEFMTGSSTTLDEIGFEKEMKENTDDYTNLADVVRAESDDLKRRDLRRKTVTADYFLGSVGAITEDGTLIACDQTGSRVGAYLYAAKNLIVISGTNKIVKDLEEGMKRIKEYVVPLEDQRSLKAYNSPTSANKWIIFEREKTPERVHVILIKEALGF